MPDPTVAAYQKALRQAQGSADDVVAAHLWLPLLYMRRSDVLPIDEQLGIANLALVEAGRSWPTSAAKGKGYSFSWYAGNIIRKALAEARRAALAVSVSRREHLALRRLRRALETAGDDATDAELAEALGWPLERVTRLRAAASMLEAPASLDEPAFAADDPETALDTLPDPGADTEAEALANVERQRAREELARAIDELSPLAATALSLGFGIPPSAERTLAFDDVLRVAEHLPVLAYYGLRRLRGTVQEARP